MTSFKQIRTLLTEQEYTTKKIDQFEKLYRLFKSSGQTTAWENISTPRDGSIIPYDKLAPVSDKDKNTLLSKLAVCKLNGGLGTSMGCVGPKSAIEIKNGKSFLDIIVDQIHCLNQKYNCNVPLILMNSFNTDLDTKKIIHKYSDILSIQTFRQNQYPRLRKDSMLPMSPLKFGDQASYPPGHGDFYSSINESGILDQLIADGIEYLFVANADNLGASVDLKILNLMYTSQTPFIMEATDRTRADVKGGTLVHTPDHTLSLLEIAQVSEEHLEEFKSIKKFKIFNTNNIWLNLKSLKEKIEHQALTLNVIVNTKIVEHLPIIQLETAIGSAISSFEKSLSVNVPRDRFLPVKKTDDLLLVQSNLFLIKDGVLVRNPDRQFNGLPLIRLGENFKTVEEYSRRFQTIPDILELDLLTVVGDVYFGKRNILRGNVILVCERGELHMPDNSIVENKVLTGTLKVGKL